MEQAQEQREGYIPDPRTSVHKHLSKPRSLTTKLCFVGMKLSRWKSASPTVSSSGSSILRIEPISWLCRSARKEVFKFSRTHLSVIRFRFGWSATQYQERQSIQTLYVRHL